MRVCLCVAHPLINGCSERNKAIYPELFGGKSSCMSHLGLATCEKQQREKKANVDDSPGRICRKYIFSGQKKKSIARRSHYIEQKKP